MATAVYQGKPVAVEKRNAAAAAIYRKAAGWSPGRRKADGHPFFIIPGTPVRQKDGTVVEVAYWVDQNNCTCDSRRWNRGACKHMLAVRLWFAAWQRGDIILPARYTRRDRELLEAAAAATGELDQADEADRLLFEYEAERAQVRNEPATAWWAGDDGRPVWLKPEDLYVADVVPAPGQATDPRDQSRPFPSHLSGSERSQAMLEAFDSGSWEPALTPEDEAALAAYEASLQPAPADPPRGFAHGYDQLFPLNPLEE